MECPTDIIIEIIKYLKIDQLFKLSTLCQTSYRFLYKKLLSIKSLRISAYNERTIIEIDDSWITLHRIKILNKFINLNRVKISTNNVSILNRIVECLSEGIERFDLITSVDNFEWDKLFKFKELRYLYLNDKMIDDEGEHKIFKILENTKLNYIYIHSYTRYWPFDGQLFILSKNLQNIPDVEDMLTSIKNENPEKQFLITSL